MSRMILIFETLAFTVFLFWTLSLEGTGGLDTLGTLWTVFGILTATPAAVIMKYFGARTVEKQSRLAVAQGFPLVSGVAGLIQAFRK